MNKRLRQYSPSEKIAFVNEFNSTLDAKTVAKYLNELANFMPDIYFIVQEPYNGMTAVCVVRSSSENDKHCWFEISEAFMKGLNHI